MEKQNLLINTDQLSPKAIERFLSKLQKTDTCWFWKGDSDVEHPNFIHDDGHIERARRVSYKLFTGPIPVSRLILSDCGERMCVNPEHAVLNSPAPKVPLNSRHVRKFWEQVDKSGGPDACWLWTGRLSDTGSYGQFFVGSLRYVHVIAYELHHNITLSPGILVRHTCDVRRCVNPSHLVTGSHQDNCDDRVNRGRSKSARGEDNGLAKLKDADIQAIRRDYAAGLAAIAKQKQIAENAETSLKELRHNWTLPTSLRQEIRGRREAALAAIREINKSRANIPNLAKKYSVSVGLIGKIINRDMWTHVPDLPVPELPPCQPAALAA